MSRLGSMIVRLALENLAGYKGELDQAATATEKSSQRMEQAGRKAADGLGRMKDAADGNVGAAVELAASAGPVVAGLAAVAAGAGLATLAYVQGSREAQGYEKALILTGNAAGTTSSQMQAMAANIAAAKGTHAAAAAALAEIAGTGLVAGQNLELLGESAVRSQKVLGTSVSDSAKMFAKLGEAPVTASIELNKSMNYLTASTFAQIKAAEDLGDKSTAAALAQTAAADATIDATKRVEANLGTLERAWISVAGFADKAWDKFKGIGRQEGAVQALENASAEVKNLQDQIAKSKWGVPELERRLQLATANRDIAQQTVDAEAQAAKAQAANAQAQKDGIEAMQAVDAMNTKALTKTQQLEKALKGYREQLAAIKAVSPDDSRLAPGQIKATEDYLRKQYAESAGRTTQTVSESAKGLALYNDLMDQSAGFTAKWTEEVNRLAAAYKSGAIQSYEEYSAAVQVLLAKQPVMVKQAKATKEAQEAEAKALAEATKERERYNQGLERSADSVEAQVQKLKDEETGLQLAAEQNISLASAIAQVEVARLREAQAWAQSSNDMRAVDAIQREIDARLKLATLMDGKEAREAAKRGAEDAVKEWQRASEKISDSITDGLMRGFEAGKDLITNFRDTFANVMQTQLVRPGVQGLVNGGLHLLGMGGTGTAASVAGAANATGGLSTLSVAKGWLTDFGGSFTQTMNTAGQKLYELGFEKIGGGLMDATSEAGSFSTIADYAQTAGDALGYLNTAVLASEGKWGAAIGSGIGTYFGGPIGAAIGGAIGGFVDNAFGGGHEYTVGQGVAGTIGASGVSGRSYQDWKNDGSSGLFGIGGSAASSGRNYSAMDSGLASGMGAAYLAMTAQTTAFAAALGETASTINTYSQDFTVALGADAAANQAAIETMVKGAANAAAATVLDARYMQAGEDATTTLQRLATSLQTVNAAFAATDKQLLTLSQSNGAASSALITLMGGTDQFQSTLSAYMQAYYNEDERAAKTLATLQSNFSGLNLTLPTTIEGYRDLVNAQDVTTASGLQTYAALMSMSAAFASITERVDSVTDAFVAVAGSIQTLFSSITSEKSNVASSAAQIGPQGVMSLSQLKTSIAAVDVAIPNKNAVSAAVTALAAADARVATASTLANTTAAAAQNIANAVATSNQALAAQSSSYAALLATPTTVRMHGVRGTWWGGSEGYDYDAYNPAYGAAQNAYGNAQQRYQATVTDLANARAQYGTSAAQNPAAQAALTAATNAQAVAAANLKAEQLAYAEAVKKFTNDAAKSVSTLGKLREETVRYYEAQQAIANQMVASSSNLKAAVANLRTEQLDPATVLQQKLAQFDSAYTMALSTNGSVQAEYADKLTALLPDLSTALEGSVGSREEWIAATSALAAKSDAIAKLLDTNVAGMDYQADSLALLKSIDMTLDVLGDSTKLITDAITGGSGLTAAGLREVVTALGGTPGFAVGTNYVPHDMFARIHEGEAIVPKAYNPFNPGAKRAGGTVVQGGGDGATAAEVKAMREELKAQTRGNQTLSLRLVKSQELMARILEQWEEEGMPGARAGVTA